tara:strand:- start:377 stop:556 length:180 start_codon:yes stop_codon:yes gene_type:complete
MKMEINMDRKTLIGFSDKQHEAIAEAANKTGLSFTAFVRMAALIEVDKAGVKLNPPKVD